MNNYARYRNWWRETVYDRYYHEEQFVVAFAEHINTMTLYELMETLEDCVGDDGKQ